MSQYSLAKGIRPDKLAVDVNRLMSDGWHPHGSPQYDLAGGVWFQAMVREAQNGNGDVRLREPKRK